MAKGHKPKKGSRAYWPKKRAARTYPNMKTPGKGDSGLLSFAAYKAGMSRAVYVDTRKGTVTSGQEVIRPVTVFECPPLVACAIKMYKKSPYGLKDAGVIWMDKIPKDLYRKTNTPKQTDSKKAIADAEKSLDGLEDIRLIAFTKPRETGIGKKKPEMFEMRLGGELKAKWDYAKSKLGSDIRANDVFTDGEVIDAVAVTKGKGFQGPVKRFGVKIRPRKHEKKRRHVGNIGATGPRRVLPAVIAMPGQLGYQSRTEFNKKILKIGDRPEEVNPRGGMVNYGIVKGPYMVVSGSVPGPKKRLVMLRKAIRNYKDSPPVEFKKVLLDSQNQ